jgi:gamma-butyrobetaine dioxygenase
VTPLHLSTTPATLTLGWPDGSEQTLTALWLLDNAPEHRDPHSGQRLIDVADLPVAPRIRAASLEEEWVRIDWDGGIATVRLRAAWLHAQRPGGAARDTVTPRLWPDGASMQMERDVAIASLAALATDAGVRRVWLERLLAQGLALAREVPCTDEGILEAVRLIGQVQETNYGLVFEVRSVPQPENLAYSDLGLGLHTDNPYREPVPGFQALHALLVPPDGGDSLFADGFAVAQDLRQRDPDAFATLARTPVPFRYASRAAELSAERPLIELDCRGEVTAVAYNSRSIAPLRLEPRPAERFYLAYRRFAERLRDPAFMLRHRLAAGELVVFDNRRILHGRTAFSSARHPRHLRGCYLTRDSVHSTAALLARTHGAPA